MKITKNNATLFFLIPLLFILPCSFVLFYIPYQYKSEIMYAGDTERDYTPYTCNVFELGDVGLYYKHLFDEHPDFVGEVIKIEPKPTNEYIHWITLKDISGNERIFCESLLVKLYSHKKLRN